HRRGLVPWRTRRSLSRTSTLRPPTTNHQPPTSEESWLGPAKIAIDGVDEHVARPVASALEQPVVVHRRPGPLDLLQRQSLPDHCTDTIADDRHHVAIVG